MTLAQLVEKIRVDLYEGKDQDNPSVVSRLLILEKDMSEVKEARRETRVWFLGVIGTIVATLILMHLRIL